MKIHKKLSLLVYAGAALSLLLVILVGAASLFFSGQQKQKEYMVEHTYQVLGKVRAVQDHLYEMAIDKQKHRITGLENFLHSFGFHSDSLLAELNALNKLVLDNPIQVEKIKLLRRQINGLLKFWKDENINLKTADAGSVLSVARAEKAAMDSVKLNMAGISLNERTLLQQREEANALLREKTTFAIIAGTVLNLVLVSILIYFVLQELKNRINEYQKEKEINQLKSSFVSLASHEFRTPLSAILLSVSLIEKYSNSGDTENVSKHSQKIKTVVNSLKGILEDFLSLEKLDAGQVKAQLRFFDLNELCDDVIGEMKMIAGIGQALHFERNGLQEMVNLDKNLIRNSIINLITNALKYGGDKVIVVLEVTVLANRLVINVKDNGIGIPEEYHAELLNPFFRVDNAGNIPGTGLGLSIVSRYVKLMGGDLSFSSVPGKETCFVMSFPLS